MSRADCALSKKSSLCERPFRLKIKINIESYFLLSRKNIWPCQEKIFESLNFKHNSKWIVNFSKPWWTTLHIKAKKWLTDFDFNNIWIGNKNISILSMLFQLRKFHWFCINYSMIWKENLCSNLSQKFSMTKLEKNLINFILEKPNEKQIKETFHPHKFYWESLIKKRMKNRYCRKLKIGIPLLMLQIQSCDECQASFYR
jgi:hypothetical protein